MIRENGCDMIGILQIIDLFDPSWLFILPVGRFEEIHIHCLGLKFAGVKDVKDFKTDVLYRSFVEHPIKDKHVEYWLLIIKVYVELIKVYFPVIVEYVTVVLGKFDWRYVASCMAL